MDFRNEMALNEPILDPRCTEHNKNDTYFPCRDLSTGPGFDDEMARSNKPLLFLVSFTRSILQNLQV